MIGINNLTATTGISFAIPSKYAKQFLESKEKTFTKGHPYLGITMVSITPQILSIFKDQASDIRIPNNISEGIIIVDISPNSPADLAGVHRGDIIVKANNKNVFRNIELLNILRDSPDITLTILRGDTELTLKVKPEFVSKPFEF